MKIVINSLKVPMLLGIYPHEKQLLIHPEISITFSFKKQKILLIKKLDDTLNYDSVVKKVEKELSGKEFDLIEEVIQKIHFLLKQEKHYLKIEISVKKFGTHESVQGITISESFYRNFMCFLYCRIWNI